MCFGCREKILEIPRYRSCVRLSAGRPDFLSPRGAGGTYKHVNAGSPDADPGGHEHADRRIAPVEPAADDGDGRIDRVVEGGPLFDSPVRGGAPTETSESAFASPGSSLLGLVKGNSFFGRRRSRA